MRILSRIYLRLLCMILKVEHNPTRLFYKQEVFLSSVEDVNSIRRSVQLLLGKKSKNVFRFFEFRLGINFFHFRLRCFEEVESRLGSPEAGVEIGTG